MILNRPPKDWKRPKMPVSVQFLVMKRKLEELLGGPIEFDHRPALWERKFDTATNDTIPVANSPRHIEVISKEEHRRRTSGTKATSAGSDTHRRAKEKRLQAVQRPMPTALQLAQLLMDQEERKYEKPKLRSRPMPGTKASGIRKRWNGKVERR
jgi:hypothetical protein